MVNKTEYLVVETPEELAEELEKTFAGHIEDNNWLPLAKWILEIHEQAQSK